MKKAANADGFEYRKQDDRENRLLVKRDRVNDEAVVHAVNNGASSTGDSA